MTENELRQLETLVQKYRNNFAWNFGKNKDETGEVSDAMLRNIRQTIANGGTYYDKQFLIKGIS
jgi:ribosomal protein S17E